MFSALNGIKLKINTKKISEKIPKYVGNNNANNPKDKEDTKIKL